MGGKVVISIVSLILVVGVVIGAVVVVRHGNSEVSGASRGSMKSVDKFCEPAPFKDACARSLESVANNASATPKDYLIAALQATVEEVNKGLDVVGNTKIDEKNDSFHHMAVEDCKELLGYAVDELQAAITSVGNSQLHTLSDRVHDLLNWLGAVYSYQTYCIDEFEKPVYKSSIQNGLLNATRLTNNAMDIVASLSDILKSFNIPIPSTNRKLLGAMGHDGFPTWFQAGDRKLLAQQESGQLVPNAVVAKDGSGQFKTISDALRAYPPKGFTGRYIIYVKAGVYEENVIVDKKQTNVFIYGDGAGKTIVTGDKNYGIMHIQTSNTATFSALGNGFIARGMTFRNTAGPEGHQAVALRLQSDMSAVFDCNIEGYQDTLYYQVHRQFYRNCVISGTIDFIFGKGAAVIQNSLIVVRKGLSNQKNTITADGKEVAALGTGLVLQNCTIVAGDDLGPDQMRVASFLGRPWKKFAVTVIMQSDLGDFIRPEGYMKWQGATNEKTCEYLEFDNRGPKADMATRDKTFTKSRRLDAKEAGFYTVNSFLKGDEWLPATGIPFNGGL